MAILSSLHKPFKWSYFTLGLTFEELKANRLSSLCNFYASTSPLLNNQSQLEPRDDVTPHDDPFVHDVTETYRCFTEEKCYALRDGDRQIFLAATTAVPTFALR